MVPGRPAENPERLHRLRERSASQLPEVAPVVQPVVVLEPAVTDVGAVVHAGDEEINASIETNRNFFFFIAPLPGSRIERFQT